MPCCLSQHHQHHLLALGFPKSHRGHQTSPHQQDHTCYLADVTGEENVHVFVFAFQLVGDGGERAGGLRVIRLLQEQEQARNSSRWLQKAVAGVTAAGEGCGHSAATGRLLRSLPPQRAALGVLCAF